MSAEYVALSFFKSNHIHYHFKRPFITFPCPCCCDEAKMDVEKTLWSCAQCGDYGTLVTLMDLIAKDEVSRRILQQMPIYHPNEEWTLIKSQFERLTFKHGSSIEKLYQKVCQLVEYYQKERRLH